MPAIADFLRDVDRAWEAAGAGRIRLRLIGSGALMLQTGYERGTKDGDILETAELSPETRTALRALGGRDVVDVVVSKLVRFSGNDAADIAAMIDGGHVAHDVFVERFRGAVDMFAHDARADDLPKIIERFHRVERDDFGVEDTEIELPSWI